MKNRTDEANGTYETKDRCRGPGLILLVSLVPFVPLASLAGAPDVAKGLVAHYTFDKDGSDASGNGHAATVKGASAAAEGRLGGALSFNGTSDYVAVPPGVTQGLTWFTVALWLRTTQSAASPRTRFWSNPTLIGVATGGWGSRDFGLMLEDGKLAYFHGLHAEGSDMSWWSAAAVADDKWHHVAFVCEGPRVVLYLDGKLTRGEAVRHKGEGLDSLGKQTQTAAGRALGATPVFIGACNEGGPNYCFRGLIDDVRIWSRALTAAEVAALLTGE